VTPLQQHQDQFGLDAAVMATGGAEEHNRVKTERTAEQSTGCRRPQRCWLLANTVENIGRIIHREAENRANFFVRISFNTSQKLVNFFVCRNA